MSLYCQIHFYSFEELVWQSVLYVQDQNPKRALFLVHREQIAKQALQSYRNVFGNTKTFELLSGNSKDINVDYLFATMQTMSKKDVYTSFAPDTFDTIIIDEAHRIGAKSYQEIMDYFKPKFWLGMSASPERTDDFDVYAAFDHNIAYEIRLQQALEENLLCPFHYFGITDFLTDGNETDFNTFSTITIVIGLFDNLVDSLVGCKIVEVGKVCFVSVC